MTAFDTTTLTRNIQALPQTTPVGRIVGIAGSVLQVSGLSGVAKIGDRGVVQQVGGRKLQAEVLRIAADSVQLLCDAPPDGAALGDPVFLYPAPEFAPCDRWIGRVIDPFGRPMDGKPLSNGGIARPVQAAPPLAGARRGLGHRVATGLAVMNTMLPVVTGQRLGLFAGSGVGKSSLLARLARSMQADVVVLALIGERGREVRDFVDRVLGPDGMARSVVVAATSDQSALMRRRCAWSAMAVAEHFRDQGKNVLFLADSVTRFAEAHREIATASGEAPALRGHPPSVTPLITGLCERAGPGADAQGDITAIFSVLVAGSDMDEPVADILRGVLDGHIVMSRDIAERGRYPAIDVLKSVSRSLPDAATSTENKIIAEVRKYLGAYERSEVMIRAGLYAEGTDPVLDTAVRLWPDLDALFARADAADARDVQPGFDRLKLMLRRAGVSIG